jgi:hypothetical protein
MTKLPIPAHSVRAFDLGPNVFVDIADWKREFPHHIEVHRVVAKEFVLVFYREFE